MSGTDLGYAATAVPASGSGGCSFPSELSPISLRPCYAMSGTDPAQSASGIRACYAMSGTGLAYGAFCERICYAMSGIDLADRASSLRACYAMSGTDVAYGMPRGGKSASRFPSLCYAAQCCR
eukprot:3774984-Rhodomonas_salina.1